MKELKIIITITDAEVLEACKEEHPQIIADDFRRDPAGWLMGMHDMVIEVVKVKK